MHHISFLRAWLQGIDLRTAWERYLAFADPVGDMRHIQAVRRDLLSTVLRLGHALDLTLPPERKITRQLRTLSQEPIISPAQVLPSLDEFVAIQGVDADMYSEAELLELYQEHYQGDGASSAASSISGEHVRSLNQVASVLAVRPMPTDPVTRWFAPALAVKLRTAGIISLADLVGCINVHGYHWHKKISALGARGAQRILGWLQTLDDPAMVVRATSTEPPQRSAVARSIETRLVDVGPSYGVVPLEQLLVPSVLSGERGIFRTGQPNTLGASNDLDAINAWLAQYRDRPHTHRSYKAQVERFLLWALHVQRKPLSSLDSVDCLAYRRFLADVPLTWRNLTGAPPGAPDWRPYRGPLSPASQRLALVVIQAMFEGLRNAGYLAANPMSSVGKTAALPSPTLALDRSFSAREWAYVMQQAERVPNHCARGRLLLILELLSSMGLRKDELANATLDDLQRVEVRGEPDAHILAVTGKRNKRREVPVPDSVMDRIAEHHQQYDDAGWPTSRSLVRAANSPRRWLDQQGEAVLAAPNPTGGLGASGIYNTLKRFFAKVARRAAEQGGADGIDPTRIAKASTHWLRHTFGRQAAADEVPIEVIQQALGHSSISTTTIYTTTERDRMIRALRSRKSL